MPHQSRETGHTLYGKLEVEFEDGIKGEIKVEIEGEHKGRNVGDYMVDLQMGLMANEVEPH